MGLCKNGSAGCSKAGAELSRRRANAGGGVPDTVRDWLLDLVRAREAAKKDVPRARHRLNKFLLRHGRRPPMAVQRWTYLDWVRREVHFERLAQEATVLDYLHEVENTVARIARLDGAIEEALQGAPLKMRALLRHCSRYEDSRTFRRWPSSPNWQTTPGLPEQRS